MSVNHVRVGISLVVLGSVVLVITGLWALGYIQRPIPPLSGIGNSLLGVGVFGLGAYLLTRDDSVP